MRVVVISGNPKGKNSITVQSTEYLLQHNSQTIKDYVLQSKEENQTNMTQVV